MVYNPFVNPFKKYSLQDFAHVLVPLADAPRRSSQSDSNNEKNEKKLDRVGSEEDGSIPPDQYSTMTIEALRAEVESDIGASGHDTAYDRMWNDYFCHPVSNPYSISYFFLSAPYDIFVGEAFITPSCFTWMALDLFPASRQEQNLAL